MKYLTIIFLLLTYSISFTQDKIDYGTVHPDLPSEASDWQPLIGTCECNSVLRNPDGSWQDTTQMTWIWKYIMSGKGVQDYSYGESGSLATSIRQFIPDSSKWYVTFFSGNAPAASPGTWAGSKKGNDIVLYKSQVAPNGMEGFYKIIFSDISDAGFNWLGEWVNSSESIHYPTWKIFCKKKKEAY